MDYVQQVLIKEQIELFCHTGIILSILFILIIAYGLSKFNQKSSED